MATKTTRLHVHRTGGWLPKDHEVLKDWLSKLVKHVDTHPVPLNPILQAFQAVIESDTVIYMLATSMFQQVPTKPPYNKDPIENCQVRDYIHMLQLFNHIMTSAPTWSSVADKVGLIGFPINAILDWPMGTPSGYAFFLNEKVNAEFEKMLVFWGKYLTSADSANVLTTEPAGWFSKKAIDKLTAKGNNGTTEYAFEQLYICDPSTLHYGFESWDDFFVRKFRDGIRPIAAPDNALSDPTIPDPTAVIVNACESAPYALATGVKLRDTFWIKGQPYSLLDMLDRDPLTEKFVNGTVYQAFLSAESYHRWHSPVSGRIVKTCSIPGTYYSEPLSEGFANPLGPDPSAPNLSQGYITQVAARSLIFIHADNPHIGLMCVILVGMAEVSTCEVTVKKSQHVTKGQEIGMFHFGGSTHCLLFRSGVDLAFVEAAKPPYKDDQENLPVNSELAVVNVKG